MGFSGILTRLDQPSDAAPNGSGGKRVLLTSEAAEKALPSLLGMGVGLTQGLDAHNPTARVGVIDRAWIADAAVRVSGAIWAGDFPQYASKLKLEQASLGFSFEADRVAVESINADPLVITGLQFTGAAILQRSLAAYTTTALSCMAGRQKEGLTVSNELKLAAGAAEASNLFVPAPLVRLMAARGVDSPGDVDKLTELQLAKILENRSPSERMELRSKIWAAGIYPRSLPTFTRVEMPW